jgi:hypothetical protein
MRKRQDPYSRESIVDAINIIMPGASAAEKRALLEKMKADVERLVAEARAANISTSVISTNGD